MRVLIVDDAATIRKVIRRVLTGSAYKMQIDEAADGEQALALFASRQYELVFLDLNMPRLDGNETLARILAQSPETRVIMISTQSSRDQMPAYLDRGAAAFLMKPFFAADIDAAVEQVMRGRQSPTRPAGQPAGGDAMPYYLD